MLLEKPRNFSEILEALGISSSHLTYHLENLGELVSKTDDGKYKLSTFGEAAVATMSKVEETPKLMEPKYPPSLSIKWKSFFTVLIIGLLLCVGVSYTLYQSLNGLSVKYEELSVEYEKLKELVQLVGKGVSLQSEYTLRYEFEKLDSGAFKFEGVPWYCVIYSPYDNSTLRLFLLTDILTKSYFPISVQQGSVLDIVTNETAPLIWSTNANVSNIYYVPLAKGWYTVSLIGPVGNHLDASRKVVRFRLGPMPDGSDVHCWMSLRIVHKGEYSPFIVIHPSLQNPA